ncbi:MAG TPA: hypothetical protein VFK06_05180 [Candidatus Angelobacter sp.]|nr:hypothetical protein [Candidatus Angelobacter sp.]
MSMSVTQWVLASAFAIILLLILGVLHVRKISSSFPVFFQFTIFTFIGLLTLLVESVLRTCSAYNYFFWSFTALYTVLVFGAFHEAFLHLLKPFSAVIDLGKMLFRWATVFLLFTALLTALTTAGSGNNRIIAGIQLLERSCDLMQCGLLLLLVTFQTRMGLSWRSRGMSILLALGTYSAFDMTYSYMLEHFRGWIPQLTIVNQIVSIMVFGFLAIALWLPEPARRRAQDSPKLLILQRWNDVLSGHGFGPVPAPAMSFADSFIPGVEQTVERILAGKITQ